MADYLITFEVRVRSAANDEETAKLNAGVGILDPESAERLNVEWLGQDVVSCVKES